ncbi:Ankyrin repeat [Diplonema papillatum]|nr:Ankyrin repeat [Diplonema papillatum]
MSPEVAQSGLDVLAKLVSKGAAVNVLKRTGSPLWHGALHQGAEAVVAFFLDHGASVTLPDALGNTALHAAALLPGSRVLKLLFQHGEKDDSKKNAAPEAGAAPAVSIINKQNAAGDTPLHVACRSNRKAAAAFLLTFPAVCQNTKNNQGSTPLHLAARVGAVESGAELLKKSLVAIPETPASPSAASKAKPPAGGAAAKKQKDLAPAEPTASTEVDVEDNNGDTPLQVAMAFDQKDMVRLLIEHHASVQRKSVAHGTLLHQSITNGTVDITKSLIAGGASVHARDAQDRTPLHNAVLKNCEETVTVLLARDSLVDSQESAHGYAPLHIAAESNACAIADALIGKKASLEPRDHTCRTPLHLAALSGAVEVMASLIRHGAAVNTVDILDRTPLHIACEAARPGAVKLLLEHGADVSLPDRHKWSALHVASHAGSVACAELLIAAGAHLNEPDYRNRTPLILASEACKVDMGKLLVNSWAKGTQKETASA